MNKKLLIGTIVLLGIVAVLIVLMVGVVVYNAVYGMSEIADAVPHYIGFFSLGVFDVATFGGLVIFLKGRRKQDKGIPK